MEEANNFTEKAEERSSNEEVRGKIQALNSEEVYIEVIGSGIATELPKSSTMEFERAIEKGP